ncbi:hypothetical protein NDU88_003830 [Pleurodeles waltl]|uniref:Uncharacterized protein n=1 Tax=Pleurodeles waltl TaxID=8319 RepID=A0AAV7W391_PLEWA|nr:hypothetical protein NDU88_003830 [Pleurodeles waltl]
MSDGQSLRRAAWPREDPDYVAPAPRTEVRWPIAKTGSMTTRGAGLLGPSAPDGAETRTEPTCGLRDLAGRQRR